MDLLERESYPGAFAGFRAFRWYKGKLRSLSASDPKAHPKAQYGEILKPRTYGWEISGEKAICLNPSSEHEAPVSNCTCGLWAYKSLDDLLTEPLLYPCGYSPLDPEPVVLALCAAWGRIVLHEKGMRAEHMRPVALIEMSIPKDDFSMLLARNASITDYHRILWSATTGDRNEISFTVPEDLQAIAGEHGIEVVGSEGATAPANRYGLSVMEYERRKPMHQFYDTRSGRITFEQDESHLMPTSQRLPRPTPASERHRIELHGLEPFGVGETTDGSSGPAELRPGIQVWAYEDYPHKDTTGMPFVREAHEDLARDMFRLLTHSGRSDFEDTSHSRDMSFYMLYVRARYGNRRGLYLQSLYPQGLNLALAAAREESKECRDQWAAIELAIAGESRAQRVARADGDSVRENRIREQIDHLFDRLQSLGEIRDRTNGEIGRLEEEIDRRAALERKRLEQMERIGRAFTTAGASVKKAVKSIEYLHRAACWQSPGDALSALSVQALGSGGLADNLLTASPNRCCGGAHDEDGSRNLCRRAFDVFLRGTRRAWRWCVHLVAESPGRISRSAYSCALPSNSNCQVSGEVRMEG